MTSRPTALVRLARELRRRRVFTTAGLYVVGAWLVMQAADVFFPGWGIPDTGINVLLIAAIVGFPVALVFGWFFNITAHGIRRTISIGAEGAGEPRPLKGKDYLALGSLVLVAGGIIAYTTIEILTLQGVEPQPSLVEKLPNSIAVLPFDNISTDPGNEIFSDGVSEEIRNRLGHYGDLHVIARTSSFQFKGSDYGIPRISELLGVRFLLKGSVRKVGDRIRVSAQLVADKGNQLWTENYDRVLADVFGIQDEIADLVAAEVAPKIVAGLKGSYKPSVDAYEHFLAGRELLHRRDAYAARKELAEAVRLDPGYAEAQAEYAISLLIGSPNEQNLRAADAAIEAAFSSVRDLPRALAARGLFFTQQSSADPVAAEAVLRQALATDPNMVDAMNWLSGALSLQDKDKEAREWQAKAYALDPFNGAVAVNMARTVWEDGNTDRAEAMLRRLIDLPEPPLLPFFTLCEFYSTTGRLVEANRIAKRLLLTGSRSRYWLLHSYASLGMFQSLEYWTERGIRAPKLADSVWVRSGFAQAINLYWKSEYAKAAEEMREGLSRNEIALSEQSPAFSFLYGTNQALAGDLSGAVATLEAATKRASEVLTFFTSEQFQLNPGQALAWAYIQSGMSDKARRLLETQERWFLDYRGSVEIVDSRTLYEAALNARLMNDSELALERLQQAVSAGWREYYIKRNDPRWGALSDDGRFQALMAKVKADVDRQRAEVERIEAEEDFPALLDKVREKQQATAE